MRPVLSIALRLRLRRLVGLRNKAVVQYRNLGKASVVENSERLERRIKEQLAEIRRLDREIEDIQASARSRKSKPLP